MNRPVSWKIALPVVAAALAVCGFVYSRIPTGMVVRMTAAGRGGRNGPGRVRMPRRRPTPSPKASKKAAPKAGSTSANAG